MSQRVTEGSRVSRRQARRSRERRRSRIRAIAFAVVSVIVVAAAALTVLLIQQSRDIAPRTAEAAATSTTGVTSPYDLTELPAETNLDLTEDASFVSILVPSDAGVPTSYGISSDLVAAQALSKAIRDAEEVGAEIAAATTEGGSPTGSTIIFVLPSRDTITFVLDLEQGLVSRGGRVWRPSGDLRALVEAATAGP